MCVKLWTHGDGVGRQAKKQLRSKEPQEILKKQLRSKEPKKILKKQLRSKEPKEILVRNPRKSNEEPFNKVIYEA